MNNLKRFAVSSLVTFIATFAISFGATISDNSFTFSKATVGALLVSAVFVAVRAVAKVVVEFAMGYVAK